MRLQDKAENFAKKYGFTGGPIHSFERIGRLYLITLLEQGLYPDSKVLDIGAGALRGGYWLIHFLDPGCYFGIEPNKERLEAGASEFLEPGLLEIKQPHFDHNDKLDFSVFQQKFDFVIARSIWSHASKAQIETMLDSFVNNSNQNAVFLASYIKPETPEEEHLENKWIGVAHHSFSWIENECSKRKLIAKDLQKRVRNNQHWVKIVKEN